jgi:hypothetical protein
MTPARATLKLDDLARELVEGWLGLVTDTAAVSEGRLRAAV